MRILSWNVNGVRACVNKGLLRWWARARGDVLGMQEVRAQPEQVAPGLADKAGWHFHCVAAERRGYSGVALLSRMAADQVETSLGEARFDAEGRLQLAHYGKLTLANVYFPNGNGPKRDHSRIPYKLDFYRALYSRLQQELDRGQRVLVMGDFNTAHRDIDIARAKQNRKTSGFTAVERQELDGWLQGHFIDTFRHQHGDKTGQYSWWSQRPGLRQRNVGWRIDYVLASRNAIEFVQRAYIRAQVLGSDHCPVGVDVDPRIMGIGRSIVTRN